MLLERDAHDKGTRFLRLKKIATLGELVLHLHCSARTDVQRADHPGVRLLHRQDLSTMGAMRVVRPGRAGSQGPPLK